MWKICYSIESSLSGMVLNLLHSERPKLGTVLAFLSTIGLRYSGAGQVLI